MKYILEVAKATHIELGNRGRGGSTFEVPINFNRNQKAEC